MLKTLAASLAIGLALSPLVAFAQTDTSGGGMSDKSMSDKSMAPNKPTMKPHALRKKPTTTTKTHSDAKKSGETRQRM